MCQRHMSAWKKKEKKKRKEASIMGLRPGGGLGLCGQPIHVNVAEPMLYSVISQFGKFRPEGGMEQWAVGDVVAVL